MPPEAQAGVPLAQSGAILVDGTLGQLLADIVQADHFVRTILVGKASRVGLTAAVQATNQLAGTVAVDGTLGRHTGVVGADGSGLQAGRVIQAVLQAMTVAAYVRRWTLFIHEATALTQALVADGAAGTVRVVYAGGLGLTESVQAQFVFRADLVGIAGFLVFLLADVVLAIAVRRAVGVLTALAIHAHLILAMLGTRTIRVPAAFRAGTVPPVTNQCAFAVQFI
jgi:hypothetical protein